MARIGVNALYLIPGGVGGTEIYLRSLLAALAEIDSTNDYFVFTNLETGTDLVPRQANWHWKPQAVRASFRPARIAWEQTILTLEAVRYKIDVMFNPGFTAPIFSGRPQVTVFHDLQHKRHPGYFRWFDLPFWRLLWASARRSTKLIAVSEATRDDLEHFYPFTAGRVTVVPHGVDKEFFRLDRSKIENYVLCVSTLHPHKNLGRLIRAYARQKRDFDLVLAGMRGHATAVIESLVAQLGVSDRIRVTGWIPRQQLLDLYSRTRAFVYPSTFEGFGLPVLEAMAARIPVACSDIPPLREIARDTALYFNPANEAEIAQALEKIVTDDSRVADARRRAHEFSWERAAQLTLRALTG